MNDELKLKSCPFCGSDAVLTWEGERANCGNPKCKLQQVAFTPEAWNSRPPVEAQAKEPVGHEDHTFWSMDHDSQYCRMCGDTVMNHTHKNLDEPECTCPPGTPATMGSDGRVECAECELDPTTRILAEPEPQAPRVSEEAREIARRLREMRDEQEWPLTSTVARTWFNRAAALLEEYSALSQPAQGEGKRGEQWSHDKITAYIWHYGEFPYGMGSLAPSELAKNKPWPPGEQR